AVYFSGASMSKDFAVMRDWSGPGLPFPQGLRRPDFRSSGPKRLMPQLQIKVPTISRWGKKMAVVVDLPFWKSLGPIQEVEHASNCDIAWFVMKYTHDSDRYCMKPHKVHLTTLDRAVEGLTGGYPTSLSDFEDVLLSKINDFTG
ncbi:MAG: NotI family restriction endonuclease, partial [Candidatus Sumerlaeota bacterium]